MSEWLEEYLSALPSCDDDALRNHAERYIWLSGWAVNNPHSEYHVMADAAFREAERRGKPEIYSAAYRAVSGQVAS